MKRQFNLLAAFLCANRINGETFATLCGIERTRAHRLIHAADLAHTLRVSELRAIQRHWPTLARDIRRA